MQGEGGQFEAGGARPRSTVISKILNFAPDRQLTFDPSRKLFFDSDRELIFDPSRALSFKPWRQMPFGRAGVFFRGYVCPSCRRVALPGATNCQWCRATFDEPLFYIRDDIAQDIREWKGTLSLAVCGACRLKNPSDAKFCIECGEKMGENRVERPAQPDALQAGLRKVAQRRRAGTRKVVR